MTTMLRILVALALVMGVVWAGVSAGGGQAEVRAVAVLTGDEMMGVMAGDSEGNDNCIVATRFFCINRPNRDCNAPQCENHGESSDTQQEFTQQKRLVEKETLPDVPDVKGPIWVCPIESSDGIEVNRAGIPDVKTGDKGVNKYRDADAWACYVKYQCNANGCAVDAVTGDFFCVMEEDPNSYEDKEMHVPAWPDNKSGDCPEVAPPPREIPVTDPQQNNKL